MNKIQFKSRKEASIFLLTKGIDTSNWINLDWLQHNKGQADIHMMFLAEAIYDARNESIPKELKEGEWHIPYGDDIDIEKIKKTIILPTYYDPTEDNSLAELSYYDEIYEKVLKISVARCARLSYQTLGDNPVIDYEADLRLYDNLISNGHASPSEHVAKAMSTEEYNSYLKGKMSTVMNDKFQEDFSAVSGKTPIAGAMDNESLGWCRNYRGFINLRELIETN